MVRIDKLLLMFFLAVLVSACPEKKKSDSTASARCEKISNATWVADDCVCTTGYQKHTLEDSSMRCDLISTDQGCLGQSRLVNGQCQCNDRTRTYDTSSSTPCGGRVVGGLGVQQLQQACTTASGQWSGAFCSCEQGQQFNYFTKKCESLIFHHLQQWNVPDATFYGANGQGVYTCQGDAMFHPAFGGCRDLTSDLVTSVCTTIYGGTMQGASCRCPNGGVWYRGSCFNLANDFFTAVQPPLPPALRCGLRGKRLVGNDCQGGVFFGGGRPTEPVVCDRQSIVGNGQSERVSLYPDRVEVITDYPPYRYDYIPAQSYFRERCENYSLDRGRWIRGFGQYDPSGSPQYFGECLCREGFNSYRDPDLHYQYCVANGSSPQHYHRCKWNWRRDLQFSIHFDPNSGGLTGEGCLDFKGTGNQWCFSKRFNPR